MSGTLPTAPGFRSVTIKDNSPNVITFATNGRRQVKSQSAQYWTLNIEYAPMKRATFAPLMSFITAQRGQFETFTMTAGDLSDTLTGYSGADPVVNNGAGYTAGAKSISVDGMSNSTAIVKAGDFVKFSGHNKVYMVTADLTSSGTGTGTLAISPGLITTVADNETVTVNDVPFTVFLNDNVMDFRFGLADMSAFTVEVREAL